MCDVLDAHCSHVTKCVLNVHCPLNRERLTPFARVKHIILYVWNALFSSCGTHHSKLVDSVQSSAVLVSMMHLGAVTTQKRIWERFKRETEKLKST